MGFKNWLTSPDYPLDLSADVVKQDAVGSQGLSMFCCAEQSYESAVEQSLLGGVRRE